MIGNADFTNVVQRCGKSKHFDLVLGLPESAGNDSSQLSDALRVLPGIIVAIFGCNCQPIEDLKLGFRQLASTFKNFGFQGYVMLPKLGVQPASAQEILDPEDDLGCVERLGQEIVCT